MSLDTYLGPRGNLLEETEEQAELVHLPTSSSPKRSWTRSQRSTAISCARRPLSALFAPTTRTDGLAAALDALLAAARGSRSGRRDVLVLSDRGVDEAHARDADAAGGRRDPPPPDSRRHADARPTSSCETGEVWDVHHLACLIGYGAAAVHPYLALRGGRQHWPATRGIEDCSRSRTLQRNYIAARSRRACSRSRSKMGISTVMGYRGAQIFEAIGLGPELVDRCLRRHASRLGGIGLAEIEADVLRRHGGAWSDPAAKLADPGFVRFRKDGEQHGFNPTVAKALQARRDSRQPDRLPGLPRHGQGAPADRGARPDRDQAARRGRPARRGRAGDGDRQAFRGDRDVARRALARGLPDAGDRHEPDRRAAATPARAARTRPGTTTRRTGRRRTARSSRSPPAASA